MKNKNSWLNGLAFFIIALTCVLLQKIFTPPYDVIAGNALSGTQTVYLKDRTSLSQPFISNKDGLSQIQILFVKQENSYPKDAMLSWELLSEGNSDLPLRHGTIPVRSIKNETLYSLKFEPLAVSRLNHYILKISSSLETDGLAMASSAIAQSPSYSYLLNGKKQDGTIVFYTGYTTLHFNTVILVRGLSFAIFFWILFLFREKLITSLEQQPLYRSVTTVIVVIGLCMIIIQPPLYMFDEPEHFRRVWEVSTGKFLPTTNDGVVSTRLPQYIQTTINRIYRGINDTTQNPIQIIQMLGERSGDESKLSNSNGLISSYSFLAYLLPAIFVRIGIWLGTSALALIYLARLANLIQFAGLTYMALKVSTVGKQTIATVGLLGLVVTQGVAVNVDSLMMAGSFLFLAAVFNLILPKDLSLITKREILPLVSGAILILISKHIYIPLLGLVILIPTAKFGTLKQKWKWVLIFWVIAGLLSIFLQMIVTAGNDPRIDASGINPISQLRFIVDSPINWLMVFTEAMVNNGFYYYNQFNLLNGTSTSIGIFGIIQLACILFFSWSENDSLPVQITGWHRIYCLLIAVITSMFIMLPLYLYWTPVGASFINGVQGRYFLPVIVLILTISRPNFIYRGAYIKVKLLSIMTFLLLVQIWMTRSYFY